MTDRGENNPAIVLGKPIEAWLEEYPILRRMQDFEELLWCNPRKIDAAQAIRACPIGMAEVEDASRRLDRFAAFFRAAFPETCETGGILESPLRAIPSMQRALEKATGEKIPGRMWLKCDSHLPISGSIKARGGIYEVLKFTEDIAVREGLLGGANLGKGGACLQCAEDYGVFASERFRRVFSNYSVAVGSTGNLGLSVGIVGAAFGFRVVVHMSADARQWKKDLLRSRGVKVIEYDSDYSRAVQEGRKQAQKDPACHFVDDENSVDLFLGYAVAALRLKKQLERQNIAVDASHPLFVYLPCGVGGGPGGVSFGVKLLFGDHAHCFFAEPTHAPGMLLGLSTGCHDKVCVQDFGIDNRTDADGLAVGRASKFAGKLIAPFLSGVFTVSDPSLHRLLALLADTENLFLEPSALAGMPGPGRISLSETGARYLEKEGLLASMKSATHIVWSTGGSMVPEEEMKAFYANGKALLELEKI